MWIGEGLRPGLCGFRGYSCAPQDGRDMDRDECLSGMCTEPVTPISAARPRASSILGMAVATAGLFPPGTLRP